MDFVTWLTELFTDPPKDLVLGAELRCPYGSKHSFLMLDTDQIDIENLPQATVNDCVAFTNIRPFGECYGGLPCEFHIDLESKWENPEPQTKILNGKEFITTKSVLICKAEGMAIQAVTSGQEGTMAKQWKLYMEIEKQFPGLLKILLDPYGSLYLNEGMYEIAITFLADRISKSEKKEIFLPDIYGKDNPEGELIRATLEKLLPDCDVSSCERLINGLENTGYLTGMDKVNGWDVNSLNTYMIIMLRKDCAATDEKIKTDPFARWSEENKVFTSSMSSAMTQIAYGAIMFQAMQSNPTEKAEKSLLEKLKEKFKNKFWKGSSGAEDIIQYEKLKSQYAANEIINADRVGSGLKSDPYHRAASFLSEDQLAQGRTFTFTNGDGRKMTMLQTEGEFDGVAGRYEYILNPQGQVEHQMFRPGAGIIGLK